VSFGTLRKNNFNQPKGANQITMIYALLVIGIVLIYRLIPEPSHIRLNKLKSQIVQIDYIISELTLKISQLNALNIDIKERLQNSEPLINQNLALIEKYRNEILKANQLKTEIKDEIFNLP